MQCRVLSRYSNHGASHPQPPRIGQLIRATASRVRIVVILASPALRPVGFAAQGDASVPSRRLVEVKPEELADALAQLAEGGLHGNGLGSTGQSWRHTVQMGRAPGEGETGTFLCCGTYGE